ncbi:MAG: hypothetical protein OEV86_13275 [Candidatus Krumholzibacteria bacterium]|nr:hypothetical protein [Candidatus Krumholzibacteria bacterium]
MVLVTGCDEAAGPVASHGGSSGGVSTLDDPSGEEFYQAFFQGRGPLAEEVEFIRDHYLLTYFVANAEEEARLCALLDQMISTINGLDPEFFETFGVKMRSGDHFVVEDGLAEAASITLEACLTLPNARRQLRAAARDEQLLSGAVNEIQEAVPESEVDTEQLRAFLTGAADGNGLGGASIYLWWYVAHWVVLTMNVAVAVNAAVWFAVALFKERWVPGFRPHQEKPDKGGDGPNKSSGNLLMAEMLIDYIVEHYAAPVAQAQ